MRPKDYDSYLTLPLFITLIIISMGITFLATFLYSLISAIKTGCQHSNAGQIVVLRKKLDNNLPDKDYRNRLDRALTILGCTESKQTYILGGLTGNAHHSESQAGKNYLDERQMATDMIHIEEQSRDTLENIKQLKLNSALVDMNILLITNRYHLARACQIAEGFCFIVTPCAAEKTTSRV